jgi:hypothetical protein
MKKVTLLAILATAAFSANATAQTAATETTNAKAKLIKVMTLTNVGDGLNFGTAVLTDGTAGTVTISTAAVRSYTGSAAAAALTGGATQAPTVASYTVTGTPNETYAVSLPTTPVTLTSTTAATASGTQTTMEITDFKASFDAGVTDKTTSTLSSSGGDSFVVGGLLTIKPLQIPGVYTGTYNVTINYN